MEDRHQAPLEIIDAFIDGERVDTDALKAALADSDGRDYLVDAWLLREAAQADPARGMNAAAAPAVSRPNRTPWLVAAAFAAALGGGYAIGVNINRGAPVSGNGTAPAETTSPIVSPSTGPFPVPAPTRVIQLEFRSTSASSGGN